MWWIIYNDFGQNCDFDNLGNDQIQNEEMAYWSSIVGQAVASGIITPDFKSALGEKVCQFGCEISLNMGPNTD